MGEAAEHTTGVALLDLTKKLMKYLPEKLEALNILFPESKETVIKIRQDFYKLYNLINTNSRR